MFVTFSMKSEKKQGTSITFAVPTRHTANDACGEAAAAESDAVAV
jgi:hypothetical protein